MPARVTHAPRVTRLLSSLPAWTVLPMVPVLLFATACTPALNWREVVPAGGPLKAMFPCKPSEERRTVMLVQRRLAMTVMACETADTMFALGTAEVEDPAVVATVLVALRQAAVANVAGQAEPLVLTVKGATPNPAAGAWRVSGRLPDGRTVEERLLVFSVGTRVYQVTLFGSRLSPEAVDGFVGGLSVR